MFRDDSLFVTVGGGGGGKGGLEDFDCVATKFTWFPNPVVL